MKKRDILNDAWKQPERLSKWGAQSSVPIQRPWLAHINFNLSPMDAICVGRLLFPEFVEFRGGIFLEVNFDYDGVTEWMDKLDDFSAVEKVVNHVHMFDLFSYSEDVVDIEFHQVAKLIKSAWSFALKESFPKDSFFVQVGEAEDEYGPTVSFYKAR